MTTPEERLRQMMAGARGEEPATQGQWEGFATSARRSLRIQRMMAGGAAVLLLVVGGLGAAALFGDDGPGNGNVPPAGPSEGCQDIDAPDNPDACNYDPDATETIHSIPTVPPPTEGEKPPPLREMEQWFVDNQDAELAWGTTFVPVEKDDPLSSAIEFLLIGPPGAVEEAGETTTIPRGTELIEAYVDDRVAYVDLSAEFDDEEPARPGTLRLREAQVVFTATQIEGVDSAFLYVEGDPYLGQVNPQGRGDYDDIAPPILVETPRIGEEVTSPMTVTGTANVFEATVTIELVIGEGKNAETIETFATATCGSGCRGDFSKKIEFDVNEPTDARLNVYEESAEDGSRLHEISVPITLAPRE